MLESGLKGMLHRVRALAILLMAMIALTGAPESTSAATSCEDALIQCHETAEQCVVDVGEPCEVIEECVGEVKCGPGNQWNCGELDYAEFCDWDTT